MPLPMKRFGMFTKDVALTCEASSYAPVLALLPSITAADSEISGSVPRIAASEPMASLAAIEEGGTVLVDSGRIAIQSSCH